MIACLVVDDEPLAQEVIQRFVQRTPGLELVAVCNNAIEAFGVLHRRRVDLVFLDIKMPGINGLEFIRSLKDPPALIFTTAYADHALAGFELDAVDYLLKPITYERFARSIQKLQKLQPPEPEVEEKGYTYFKVSGRLVKVDHGGLLYAQSVKDYVQLITLQGNYLTHMTMKYLDELLPSPPFIRVHRSYLVNKNVVTAIDRNSLTVHGQEIPVGDNFRDNLEKID